MPSGNQTRLRGESFENQLTSLLHPAYRRDRLAFVYRVLVASKRVRGHVIQVKTRPDYAGMLTGMGGRHVEFDAKITSKTLASGAPVYSHQKAQIHQCAMLYEVVRYGGIGFILVNWENPENKLDQRAWLLWPQPYWTEEKSFTVRLTEASEDVAMPVPAWDGVGFDYIPDWYRALALYQGLD